MTNSQKEFEKALAEVGFGGMRLKQDPIWGGYQDKNTARLCYIWNRCNAMWERKLDVAELLLVVSGLPNNNRDDGLVIARAIIKHLKGE
jgi:hypothetical protein